MRREGGEGRRTYDGEESWEEEDRSGESEPESVALRKKGRRESVSVRCEGERRGSGM